MTPEEFLGWAVHASSIIVMASIALGFYRIVKGPSFGDRVVALDMMTITIMAFCGIYSVYARDSAFIDVAIVLALVGFLTTLALARFAERRRTIVKKEEDVS